MIYFVAFVLTVILGILVGLMPTIVRNNARGQYARHQTRRIAPKTRYRRSLPPHVARIPPRDSGYSCMRYAVILSAPVGH